MGEEAKQEQPPVEAAKPEEKKVEEKTEEKKEEGKAEEDKKEEPKPPPPPPFVLFVDLHCVGCAKKIEKSILRMRGVEGVVIDMSQNQVTIKGIVEPQAICTKIMKKTKRRAKVLSPLPAAEGEPIPEVIASQVSRLTTVELNVNMHCEACALQLKKKILKMKGVRTVETELSSGKVTVSGTMDGDTLVDYVYRRTKKQAKIVPQPEVTENPPQEEAKPEDAKKEEENNKPAAVDTKNEEEKKGDEGEKPAPPPAEEEKKEGDGSGAADKGGEAWKEEEVVMVNSINGEQVMMQRMIYHQYQPPPYFIERIPSPQLFSDENPNACCIA